MGTKTNIYRVVDAKFDSSRFTWPSRAIPLRPRLLLIDGVKRMTFCMLEPG